MTTTTAPPIGPAGHIVTIAGQPVGFDTIWDGYGEEIKAVAIWTHDMPAAEVILRARAYLEGPFTITHGNPYDEYGVDRWETWPEPGGCFDGWVTRVWARWEPVPPDADRYDDYDGEQAIRWVESAKPGEGFAPASVVQLHRDPPSRAAIREYLGLPAETAPGSDEHRSG